MKAKKTIRLLGGAAVLLLAAVLLIGILAGEGKKQSAQELPDAVPGGGYDRGEEVAAPTPDGKAQSAMLLCRDIYDKADKGTSLNVILSAETIGQMVDAVFSRYGTDTAFTHEVTVRDTDAGFEYVSNYVYDAPDNIFPERILQNERIQQINSLRQP